MLLKKHDHPGFQGVNQNFETIQEFDMQSSSVSLSLPPVRSSSFPDVRSPHLGRPGPRNLLKTLGFITLEERERIVSKN